MEPYLETKLKWILVVPDFSISKFCITVKVFVVYIVFLTEEESHSKVISAVFHSWLSERPFEQKKSHKITITCNSYKMSEPTGNAHPDSVSTSDIILEGIPTSGASLLHY